MLTPICCIFAPSNRLNVPLSTNRLYILTHKFGIHSFDLSLRSCFSDPGTLAEISFRNLLVCVRAKSASALNILEPIDNKCFVVPWIKDVDGKSGAETFYHCEFVIKEYTESCFPLARVCFCVTFFKWRINTLSWSDKALQLTISNMYLDDHIRELQYFWAILPDFLSIQTGAFAFELTNTCLIDDTQPTLYDRPGKKN